MARISQYPHGKPRDPHQIFEIIQLRKENRTWRDIGKLLGMTHQGPYLLYKRWKKWSKKNKKSRGHFLDKKSR
jgi:hypothetical protein